MNLKEFKETANTFFNYEESSYTRPEKLDGKEREIMEDIKETGRKLVDGFSELAKKSIFTSAELWQSKSTGWQNSGRLQKNYFWIEFKYTKWKNFPFSVSIFLTKEDDNRICLRLCTEIKEKNSENKQKDLKQYHRILEKPLEQGLRYFKGDNKKSSSSFLSTDTEQKEAIEESKNSKVQISSHLFYLDEYDDEQKLVEELRDISTSLFKYYECIFEDFDIQDNKNQSTKQENKSDQKTDIKLNTILYGPPGTGKTYNSVNYAVAIIEGKNIDEVEKQDYADVKKRFNELISKKQISFVTFHQSFSYEDFIEGIKPNLDDDDLKYHLEDGIFKEICEIADNNSNQNYVLIIDEINRGNISKIFGELITLIEDTKRKGTSEEMTTKLPYSKDLFSVPKNLYLLGTMNTSDRSISIMDTALRRRFNFIEMLPNPEVLKNIDIEGINIACMLEKINQRIEALLDREHTIGHAFFTSLLNTENQDIKHLADIFENKVIPLLQEYFYDDYENIRLILGDNSVDNSTAFIKKEPLPFNLFGDSQDFLPIPEARYKINTEALKNSSSYLKIYTEDEK